MDWDAEYHKETGKYSTFIRDDERHTGRTYSYNCDEYVCWLEDKLDKATQQLLDNKSLNLTKTEGQVKESF